MADTIELSVLQQDAAAVLRRVRDGGTEFLITIDGEPVAQLRPCPRPSPQKPVDPEEWLARIETIAAAIGEAWPPGLTAAQAVADQRR